MKISLARIAARVTESTVGARNLAWARILIGAAGLVKAISVAPDLAAAESSSPWHDLIHFATVPWPITIATWITASGLVVLGRAVPLTAGLTALCSGWTLTYSWELYANHLVLLTLMSTYLTLTSGGRLIGTSTTSRVPGWPALLMMTQVSSMYGIAALAKVNPSFIQGELLTSSVGVNLALVSFSPALLPHFFIVMTSIAVILLESVLATGLWFSRTRKICIMAGAAMHLAIFFTMKDPPGLLVFLLASIASYPLFSGWTRGGECSSPSYIDQQKGSKLS